MNLKIALHCEDSRQNETWAQALMTALAGSGITLQMSSTEDAQVVIFSATHPRLIPALGEISREGRAIFLLADLAQPASERMAREVLAANAVDELLLAPLRTLDVVAAFQRVERVMLWKEVGALNHSFRGVLDSLKSDLQIAERLQRARFPARFPEIKGFQVHHRYLAGMRSGGDHFDLAESKDGKLLSLVLTDSSSYGLSSAVLSALMRLAVNLTRDEMHSATETITKLETELLQTLNEKDKLAIFYGTLSRRDYKLRYIHVGQSALFYAPAGKGFHPIPSQGGPLSRSTPVSARVHDTELELEPRGRLVVLSDGFVESAGGLDQCTDLLNRFREQEAVPLINELVFQVKSSFEQTDDLPGQDCTAAVLDVERNTLRPVRGATGT